MFDIRVGSKGGHQRVLLTLTDQDAADELAVAIDAALQFGFQTEGHMVSVVEVQRGTKVAPLEVVEEEDEDEIEPLADHEDSDLDDPLPSSAEFFP